MQKLIVLRLIPLLFVSDIYVFLFFSDKYDPWKMDAKIIMNFCHLTYSVFLIDL
jgi:hypothetical protein